MALTMPRCIEEAGASGVLRMMDRFEKLSDTQRRLLREVAKGRTSKAMSRDVGLEAGTIDVYLSQTLKILGVTDRHEAARALVDHEAAILNRSELRPDEVASPPAVVQSDWRRKLTALWRWLGLPPLGGQAHDYDFSDRMVAAFRIAGLGFLLIIVLVMAITGLFWAFPRN